MKIESLEVHTTGQGKVNLKFLYNTTLRKGSIPFECDLTIDQCRQLRDALHKAETKEYHQLLTKKGEIMGPM